MASNRYSGGDLTSRNPQMSFVMLSDSQTQDVASSPASPPRSTQKQESESAGFVDRTPSRDNSLSQKMETTARLFEILSARSDIDHPVCVECTDLLVDGLQRRLANATKERDAYVDFLRQANADVPSEDEVAQARRALSAARKSEAAAIAELEALEAEKAALDADQHALETESVSLEGSETAFWASRNAFTTRLSALQKSRDALTAQLAHDQLQLQRLQRCNVYNDTFSIGHDGFFGTINGLRLGRLPDHPVDWAEINAAWGHACLLLATVADKLAFAFAGYELRPMGSTSKIKQFVPARSGRAAAAATPDQQQQSQPQPPPKLVEKTYELYSSGSTSELLSLGLLHRKIDAAMVAFLECLRQLVAYSQRTVWESTDGRRRASLLEVPYRIEKDRIGDESIRLGAAGFGANDEAWTRACKNTLIMCKYLLAHCSNVSEMRKKEEG